MKSEIANSARMAGIVPARGGWVRGWQRWASYAAVGWSLIYAALGIYWIAGGSGFPYTPETMTDSLGPLLGRVEPDAALIIVMLIGIPAAVLGAAMLRGLRGAALRPLFLSAGTLLAGVLLLLMTSLDLLVKLGYLPYSLFSLISGTQFVQTYLASWMQWPTIHQLLCLVGGFLWLGATFSYARRSGDACLYCGRQAGPEGWTRPDRAARWGRVAVYVAIVAPVFYGITRYAWALGIPLGMDEAQFRLGQESGTWVSGAFLATFGLAGALLMLGLVQRWGEFFPRWMIGLAGRRVPIALAVIPVSLVLVLLTVGGITIWFDLQRMTTGLSALGADASEIIGAFIFQLGPTLLFPVWGVALAVATLGYYYRRRGPCGVCGRGGFEVGK